MSLSFLALQKHGIDLQQVAELHADVLLTLPLADLLKATGLLNFMPQEPLVCFFFFTNDQLFPHQTVLVVLGWPLNSYEEPKSIMKKKKVVLLAGNVLVGSPKKSKGSFSTDVHYESETY